MLDVSCCIDSHSFSFWESVLLEYLRGLVNLHLWLYMIEVFSCINHIIAKGKLLWGPWVLMKLTS